MSSYQKAGYQPVEQSGTESENGMNTDDKSKARRKWLYGAAAAVLTILIVLGGGKRVKGGKKKNGDESIPVAVDSAGKAKLFDEYNRYVIEDFDTRPTFSNFLPGVAGVYGKPVWSFYVNRGQGIASFGTKSKEYPIMEFNPANKAYQLTPLVGFRTFVQGSRRGNSFSTEPFTPSMTRIPGGPDEEGKPKRYMYSGTNEMEVKEFDTVNEVETSVQYFTLPHEDFSSLVRRTTFTNTGDSDLTLSFLDGLAKMEPDGGPLDGMLKNMGRTLEGWFGVYFAEDSPTMPYYRLSTEPGDTASVKIEEGGHFCLSFIESENSTATLLPIVYDTTRVFGENTPLLEPAGLATKSISDIINGPQYGDAKTSSAFAAVEGLTLSPGENITVASFYGKVDHISMVPKIAETITAPGYCNSKYEFARELIDDLLAGVDTETSNHLFNGAVKQMFLDNSLRGGLPIVLGDVDEEMKSHNADEDPRVKIFHVFSRIHGDLERDYNDFDINPTFFSQGPGNYRDVAQNRRNDVFFVPRMGAFDIKMFLGYIQADAYEPLTVEAVAYTVSDRDIAEKLAHSLTNDLLSFRVLTAILIGGPFRPGQMFGLVKQLDIKIVVDNDTFINTLVAAANQTSIGVYGTGYWADHWEYYLDLIDAYLSIYPDGEESLMYDNQLRYFFSPATVKPRSDKYILTLTYDGKSKHVLQLDATFFDQKKKDEQQAYLDAKTGRISIDANWQHTPDGEPFTSTPIAKLFLLGAIKYATRDAYGMGIEYEGGRPGWNDAMNGLVGMVGSGMPETYELYLLLKYVQDVVKKYQRPVVIPAELGVMVDKINDAVVNLGASGYTDPETLPDDVPDELFTYWDAVATAREEYREAVRYNFSGETKELSPDNLIEILDSWIDQVKLGMDRAMKIGSQGFDDDGTSGVSPCYFSYNVTGWKLNGQHNEQGLPLVNATSMSVGRFPLFLEGPVRMMKTITAEKDVMKDTYTKVLNSGLRDKELKMYFISANLKGQSYDMGRMMAFAPGWLENQSIWMHMSYKYYLELIRGKLYHEFFSEMKGGGMLPYMPPERYGRSLMECSSFLASSAFPNPADHGRGFLARLSGSTAEFLSIWTLMFIGHKPFFIDDDGSLKMQLVPGLPIWLFEDETESDLVTADEELTISYKLFAEIEVTYHNKEKKDLFGIPPKKYIVKYKDGKEVNVDGPAIPTQTAMDIRRVVKIDSIDAIF